MSVIKKTVTLPDGKEISIETGRLARQADGSAVVRCGDTMILATVVASREIKPDIDFLPLSVDYLEKYASSGKIPGGFYKREGRLGEHEILVSRLVDRVLRPMFPKDYHAEVQVIIQLISADRVENSDSLACLAACAALMSSDIPFPDPVSEVRIIRKNGEYIINPTNDQIEEADLELMVGASKDSVVMVEGEMDEVSEEVMLEAFKKAHEAIAHQCDVLAEIRKESGKEIREYDVTVIDEDLRKLVDSKVRAGIREIIESESPKQERGDRYRDLVDQATEEIAAEYTEKHGNLDEFPSLDSHVRAVAKEIQKEIVRRRVVEKNIRLDGRKQDEIRDIWCEVGYLPRAHGSSVFTRGETQSLCSMTLGTPMDEQMLDTATKEGSKKFLLHYNFPPFSTGEVKFLRGPGRREIGHGNLAERALKKVMPAEFDYTVRIVSDILESNGSSSMATVCGGALALMDGGIPIKPVSGIAMGLITEEDGSFAVLSDILGDEDFLGDMDFKVAGTKDGLTACQMDIKIRGLSYEILHKALEQSKAGRLHILEKMLETLSESRDDISKYAPRIVSFSIPSDMIGAVIGPGGKIIQEIQRTTGTTINLEEEGGKGHVSIFSPDLEGIKQAKAMIDRITELPEVGKTYTAKVKSIKDFGAFVEFLPGKEGLLHISEITHKRLDTMEGVLEIGEEFPIKLIGIDQKTGKFRLSRKALLPVPEGMESSGSGRGGREDNGGRGRSNPRHRDNK